VGGSMRLGGSVSAGGAAGVLAAARTRGVGRFGDAGRGRLSGRGTARLAEVRPGRGGACAGIAWASRVGRTPTRARPRLKPRLSMLSNALAPAFEVGRSARPLEAGRDARPAACGGGGEPGRPAQGQAVRPRGRGGGGALGTGGGLRRGAGLRCGGGAGGSLGRLLSLPVGRNSSLRASSRSLSWRRLRLIPLPARRAFFGSGGHAPQCARLRRFGRGGSGSCPARRGRHVAGRGGGPPTQAKPAPGAAVPGGACPARACRDGRAALGLSRRSGSGTRARGASTGPLLPAFRLGAHVQ
jgi:hypothetical protein